MSITPVLSRVLAARVGLAVQRMALSEQASDQLSKRRSQALQAAQHELQPEFELGSHVDAGAEDVRNRQQFLIGAGRYEVAAKRRAPRQARRKPIPLSQRIAERVDRNAERPGGFFSRPRAACSGGSGCRGWRAHRVEHQASFPMRPRGIVGDIGADMIVATCLRRMANIDCRRGLRTPLGVYTCRSESSACISVRQVVAYREERCLSSIVKTRLGENR